MLLDQDPCFITEMVWQTELKHNIIQHHSFIICLNQGLEDFDSIENNINKAVMAHCILISVEAENKGHLQWFVKITLIN